MENQFDSGASPEQERAVHFKKILISNSNKNFLENLYDRTIANCRLKRKAETIFCFRPANVYVNDN